MYANCKLFDENQCLLIWKCDFQSTYRVYFSCTLQVNDFWAELTSVETLYEILNGTYDLSLIFLNIKLEKYNFSFFPAEISKLPFRKYK